MTRAIYKPITLNGKPTYNTPGSCPKFQGCNTPICPLDAEWQKRTNHKEDATCFYLTESVKHNAKTHFEVAGLAWLYENILSVRQNITNAHARINQVLQRAQHTGSRMIRKVGANHE